MGDASWYVWIVLVFGLGSLAVSFIKVFLASDLSLPDLHMDEAPDVSSEEFRETIGLTVDSEFLDGGTAELLHNGDGFFPRFLEDVRSAEKSVHVMTFIWDDCPILREILTALTIKAEEGVDVRVMADGLGGLKMPRDLLKNLTDAGGRFKWFGPLKSVHIINVNQRNHRRAFVVDGRVAYTGGVSFSDEWTGDAQDPDHWRDIMLRLTGPPVVTVQEIFCRLWVNIAGELPYGEGLTPRTAEPPQVGEDAVGPGTRPGGEAGQPFRHLGVGHTPGIHVHPLRQMFWFSIRAAKRRVWINTAYFAPDTFIREVMRDRAEAGVDVRLLTPSENTDAPFVRWYAHRYYDELMEAGVRVFEYQPTMLHSKYIVADGCWVLTGSANMDVRSCQLNQEAVLGFHAPELAEKFEAMFEADCGKAKEFELEEWRRRGWRTRVMEKLVLPIWHQI